MLAGRLRRILLTAAVAAAFLLPLVGQALAAFTDLGAHWAASAISALQARGLLAGLPDGTFQPDAPVTRAQMAKMLAVAMGQESDARSLTGFDSRFADTTGDNWAAGYVETLAELRVIQGDPDGGFHPERLVTRAELAVLLARVAGLADSPADLDRLRFLDLLSIPEWARGAIAADSQVGLLTGDGSGVFRPLDDVTRAEAAVATLRLLAYRGAAFQLTGTLLAYAPASRTLQVRTAEGVVRRSTLSPDAAVFRQGAPAAPGDLVPGDQVWIYLNDAGTAQYVDSRFRGDKGSDAQVDGEQLVYQVSGSQVRVHVQAQALLFLNGKLAPLAALAGARQVYVVRDAATAEARLVDAISYNVAGQITGIDPAQRSLFVAQAGQPRLYSVSDGAVLFRGGQRVALRDLAVGDSVDLNADAAGVVSFVQVD